VNERRRVYLDHTATTPLAPGVLDAMQPYLTEKWLSPAGLYRGARALRRELEDARRRIAQLLAAEPNDVVFTSSGTESISLAIRGVAFGSQHRGQHIITTQIEHRAVLDSAKQLEKQGWRVTYLPVDATGVVDLAPLEAALDAETTLVSIMLANNEVGSIQPIQQAVRIVKAHGGAIPVHVDAVAAAGFVPMDVQTLGIDLLSLSSHKLGGPKGAGLLWMRRGVLLQPQILGGDQEHGRRAGTEDVPAVMGMARALELALPAAEERAATVRRLCTRLIDSVREAVPGTVVTGHPTERLPHIASFCFERVDGEALLLQLDVQGVAAASGSACTSATLEPSHVLRAMGVAPALAEGNLRLSLGVENDDEDVDYVLGKLPGVIERMRQLRK
jgi:cysteine desulfurase